MPLAMMRALVVGTALLRSSTTGWVVPIYRGIPTTKRFRGTMSASSSSSSSGTPTSRLRVLGVCGGIGSGKSRACKLLMDNVDSVVALLEADSMAHAVYTPGSEALAKIADEFGAHILQDDGTINRKELGAIVFADPAKMITLEQIVWPYVKEEIQKRLRQLEQEYESGVVVLEAAVLLDACWDDLMDAVWVVKTPPSIALERLVENRGFTSEEAQKRIDAQESRRGIGNLNDEVKRGVVTRVIENTGTEQDLQEALKQALDDPTSWKQ